MSDSEDQRNETEAQNHRQSEMSTMRKKKTHKRRLELDEDEEEFKQNAEETSNAENHADADFNQIEMDKIKDLSVNEIEEQIQAIKRQLKGKGDEVDADSQSGRKREEKAASKASAKASKAKAPEAAENPANLAALTKSRKRLQKVMTDDDKQKAATELITIMKNAVLKDNESNRNRKPALQKLLLLEQVTKELRRIPIQQDFINNGGCHQLGDWLYPLPDGTFPNVKVVSEILHIVETLHIEADFLQSAQNLVLTVKAYAKNKANMPQVQEIAKRILDKWSRMVFGISTSYYQISMADEDEDDPAENHSRRQDQYRNLRRKIDRIKHQHEAEKRQEEEDEAEEEGNVARKKKSKQQISAAQAQANEITRGSKGIIMPARNAFDFVEKPRQQEHFESRGHDMSGGQKTGHEKIKKVISGIKRLNKSGLVNRRMQTVKSDF